LELEAPATVSLSGEPAGTNAWQAGIESFKWRGSAGKIEAQAALNWPRAGDIRCAIEQLRSDLFQDFFKFPLQQIEIRKLDAFTGWTNGPMTFGIELSGTALPPRELAVLESGRGLPRSNRGSEFAEDDPRARARSGSATNFADLLASPVEVELKLRGDQRGVTLSNLVVNSQTSSVAVAHGFLPLTLSPGSRTNFFHMEIERPLQLTASTQPHPFFWGSVADWTGLILRDPSLALDVSGTWNAPQGEVRLAARQIQIPEARFPSAPSLENLRLALVLDLDKARLTECQMLLQGQPLTVTGEMPLGGGFWRALRERRLPNWEQATGSLKMKDADFAVFAAALPEVVSPAGKLNLELTLLPGGNLTGELEVQGARTRSLPNAGPIRDIGFHLTFLNRIVKLVSATGRIGEAPISVTGQADLSGTNWYQGWVPPFEVVLRGTNVPLSRQPDSVIRSDLDLTIRKTNAAPAVISGQARLRDSFYLSDLAGLIPGQVASPEQRPPFFSIEEQPLAGWRLAVLVTGVRCLGVRTTLFNGDVSANLQILGTLKEPVALGDARIETGTVRFPFAALKVRQGFVTLSSQDPYHPQLQISAASKEYGYDINLQVTGPADAPIVQFTSVPPLSSEQIVLLVTAGEIPTQSHLTSEQRAQTVAVFLGRDLLTTLGFSDAGESRLTFHSGEQLTEQGGPTYNLEYKLSERWSLTGEYDRFNAYNAGLKWRIYSK
jgi:translocation and assembly module TamB